VHRFEALLETEEGSRATYFQVPLDVARVFGRARPPVRGTINGFPFRSTIAKYGESYYLPVNAKLRESAGVAARETIAVELDRDTEPRAAEPPPTTARHSTVTLTHAGSSTPSRTRTRRSTCSGSRRPSARRRVAGESSRRSRCCATASRGS
jgi:Domain of unknown function (DUF1905)